MSEHSTPPLTWLRAFEAAGRLGSFKQAAFELNVSPSTISHQIRDLEVHLGLPLFNRRSKPIELTEEGQQLLPALSSGFSLIHSAFATMNKPDQGFRIGSMPFLTNEVLLPNVDRLKTALQEDQLSFRSETSLAVLLHSDPNQRLDSVVRYTHGEPGAGLYALELFDIELVPIQATNKPNITDLQSLLKQPVIRVHGPFDAWREWAKQMCPELESLPAPANIALETDNYHAATLAANRGDGLCLGVMPFMQPWLSEGKIQALETFRCKIPFKASLVVAGYNKDNPVLVRLRDWLAEYLTGT